MKAEVAIVGAGIIGIATAYHLARDHGINDVVLVDQGNPMAFTSAQSGENYRDWWPHPLMVDFTGRSIDLMERIARDSGNRIAMTRRGYILATRSADIQPLLDQLVMSLGDRAGSKIRCHSGGAPRYEPPLRPDWERAPDGFDVMTDPSLIRATFPSLDPEVRSILHVRRAGDISGQQLGQYMLDWLREQGLRLVRGSVNAIRQDESYKLGLATPAGQAELSAGRIVNAAGPFAGQIARMLGVDLPVYNVLQQKIAFPDAARAIPRTMPFAIDLDRQLIDWAGDERELLLGDPSASFLAEEMPGSIHCRPDGGDAGSWIKLGWAYNAAPGEVSRDPTLDPRFPEIVLRGAARLHPALQAYYGRLPRQMHHYGGWYTRTADNWPLIGPMGPEGAFMACALSGHGTMAACASGELAAAWIAGVPKPDYARPFSLARYSDPVLAAPVEAESGLL